jgi:hypothetical protein
MRDGHPAAKLATGRQHDGVCTPRCLRIIDAFQRN